MEYYTVMKIKLQLHEKNSGEFYKRNIEFLKSKTQKKTHGKYIIIIG